MNEIPSSVYRLQLNEQFPLKQAMAIIPYLHELGIEGIYCSPIFSSASGGGYDIVNPNHLDEHIGTMEEYNAFCTLLKKYGMKQLLDVVPNHMSIKSEKNIWWLDVMENGPNSPYAGFFDIHWHSIKPGLQGKVLLPILKDPYGRALEKGDIELLWNDGFWVRYFDFNLPIAFATYEFLLSCFSRTLPPLQKEEEKEWLECLSIVKEGKKENFVDLFRRSPFIRSRMDLLLAASKGNKEDPHSLDCLDELLEKQFYRLSHWLLAEQEINYRRFFNLNDLIALHIEKENVLKTHHQWVFDLVKEGQVQGLRIDHVDGLYDPGHYLEKIQEKKPAFVVVEKILGHEEKLCESWPVNGTVGYEYLSALNGLFIQKRNEKAFSKLYTRFINHTLEFDTVLYERRKHYVSLYMQSESQFLGELLAELAEKSRYTRDFTRLDLTRAVREILTCFPVYRTYIKPGMEVSKADRQSVIHAINAAKGKTPEINAVIYQYIQDILLLELPLSEEEGTLAQDFLMRLQQVTGTVMAKGLEDSTFYVYNRFISLNEVGSSPKYFGTTADEFHEMNKEKLKKWPLGLLASSTHDSKMSEDLHACLNVLSEMPNEWRDFVMEAKKHNRKYKTLIDGALFPDSNMEYYIYQLLVGFWSEEHDVRDRLLEAIKKAMREAGIYTSWRIPNEAYEKATVTFVLSLLTPNAENTFYPAFLDFRQKIVQYGHLNSLSALVAKIGSCGIVDIYQGQECWNLSLVDPDNRRPVDFATRMQELASLVKMPAIDDPSLKIWLTQRGLIFRREHKELFLQGEYIPLATPSENVIAFIRKHNDQIAIVVFKRFFATKETDGDLEIPLHKESFRDIFTGKVYLIQKNQQHYILSLTEIFRSYPFTILTC